MTDTYRKVISVVQPMLDECATFLPVTGRRYCVTSDATAEMAEATKRLRAQLFHDVTEEWRNWLRHYDFYTSIRLIEGYKDGQYFEWPILSSLGKAHLSDVRRALWDRYAYLSQLKNIKGGNVFTSAGETLGYFDLDFLEQRRAEQERLAARPRTLNPRVYSSSGTEQG